MNLCRITGTIVSTVQNPRLQGSRILIAQPVDLDCTTPRGGSFLVTDRGIVQSGVGDLVLTIKEGGGVRILYQDKTTPVEAVVVAVVDELDVPQAWEELVGHSTLEQPRDEGADA
ncbi:MAG: EutN/CcmL family microcompartment protein [Planctomycetota bacterium]